jgi:hypothetical protein
VVIQNAEVCHVGDVLGYMGEKITPNNYYVCDVRSLKSFCSNNYIYQCNTNTIDIYNLKNVYRKWYQGKSRMSNLHFLVGMTLDTFDKLKRFSYDYSFGVDADDIDFLIKIKSKNINIVNLFHDEYYFDFIFISHIFISKMGKYRE